MYDGALPAVTYSVELLELAYSSKRPSSREVVSPRLAYEDANRATASSDTPPIPAPVTASVTRPLRTMSGWKVKSMPSMVEPSAMVSAVAPS